MKRILSIVIIVCALLTSCNDEPSLQKYFVEKTENKNLEIWLERKKAGHMKNIFQVNVTHTITCGMKCLIIMYMMIMVVIMKDMAVI